MPQLRSWRLPLAATAAAVSLLSCSPLVRVEATFSLPGGMKPDPARLYVTVNKACKSFTQSKPMPPPPAAPEPGPKGQQGATLRGGKLIFVASGRSFRCFFHMAAWYDANGNREVDVGDAVGKLPAPVESEDKGLCAGNLAQAPEVTLARVRGPIRRGDGATGPRAPANRSAPAPRESPGRR